MIVASGPDGAETRVVLDDECFDPFDRPTETSVLRFTYSPHSLDVNHIPLPLPMPATVPIPRKGKFYAV